MYILKEVWNENTEMVPCVVEWQEGGGGEGVRTDFLMGMKPSFNQ